MRIQPRNPTFKPIEEFPIVLVWIALTELPLHCYYKDILTTMLSVVLKLIYFDNNNMNKTRGIMARVRIQLDLIKDRPKHVWIAYDKEDLNQDQCKFFEYEHVPTYSHYFKHHGHMIKECTASLMDEDFQRTNGNGSWKKGLE